MKLLDAVQWCARCECATGLHMVAAWCAWRECTTGLHRVAAWCAWGECATGLHRVAAWWARCECAAGLHDTLYGVHDMSVPDACMFACFTHMYLAVFTWPRGSCNVIDSIRTCQQWVIGTYLTCGVGALMVLAKVFLIMLNHCTACRRKRQHSLYNVSLKGLSGEI
jgi:hypothetical protein